MQDIVKHLAFVGLFFLYIAASGQYEKSPLEGKQWAGYSVGVNTADHLSWQMLFAYSRRNDYLLTTARLAYSQEWIEAENDSMTYRKNRLIETGILWGDGWGGKRWYVSVAAGMSLNMRMYADSAVENNTSFRYRKAMIAGVPIQINAGVWMSKNIGMQLVMPGNWNFKQPYIGIHLGVIYRFSDIVSAPYRE